MLAVVEESFGIEGSHQPLDLMAEYSLENCRPLLVVVVVVVVEIEAERAGSNLVVVPYLAVVEHSADTLAALQHC